MVFGKKPEIPQGFYAAPPPPPPPGPNMGSVQHNLEVRVGGLSEKMKKCDEDLAYYKKEMKRCKPGTSSHTLAKNRAYRVLKQKRMLEKQLDGTCSQQMNIDAVSMAVEEIKGIKDTLDIMDQTNKQLQKDLQKIDLDKAEDLQDDMEEILNETNYITESLGRNYNVDGIDEADLAAELDGIEEDVYMGAASAVPGYKPVQMPQSNIANEAPAPHQSIADRKTAGP